MDKIFQFKCLECELDFKLRIGAGGSSNLPKVYFYCERCKIITLEHKCENCKRPLRRIIYPLKENILEFYEENGEIKAPCPHCHSIYTILIPLDKWITDFQLW